MHQEPELVTLAMKAGGTRGRACQTCLVAWVGPAPCWCCGGAGVDRYGATS